MDGTESELCPDAGFGMTGAEILDYTLKQFVFT
jgi:hypothetical protein